MQDYSDLIGLYEQIIDEMCTGMCALAPYPVNVVGRPNPFNTEKKGGERKTDRRGKRKFRLRKKRNSR